MPEDQKMLSLLAFVVYGAIFYAAGIATNLFASPVFSMFWIISAQTAIYIAFGVGLAVTALSVVMFVYLSFFSRRKTVAPEGSVDVAVDTENLVSVDCDPLSEELDSMEDNLE